MLFLKEFIPNIQCNGFSVPGSYSLAGALSCTTCEAGKNCSDQTTAPPDCDAGYYSAEGDASCSQCPLGKSHFSDLDFFEKLKQTFNIPVN